MKEAGKYTRRSRGSGWETAHGSFLSLYVLQVFVELSADCRKVTHRCFWKDSGSQALGPTYHLRFFWVLQHPAGLFLTVPE